jgi:hypothetical protein
VTVPAVEESRYYAVTLNGLGVTFRVPPPMKPKHGASSQYHRVSIP